MKHLFQNNPTSLISVERNQCSKCGRGKNNHKHIKPSIPLMFSWLFGVKTWK